MKKQRNLASRIYKKIKKDTATSRTLFIQELATQQAALENETVSNAISRINRNKKLRESYCRIKVVTKFFCSATKKVLIPISYREEETITSDKIQIEKALPHQNKTKFTAA